MPSLGFDLFEKHFFRAPALVVAWNDQHSCAQGWLCIDELRGNAAGGGTRMHDTGTREEAIFLAKTMGVKFRVCGPDIGGAKTVLRYDHRAADKKDVLHRWYKHIAPYLRHHYGTGGDVGVDEVLDATPAIQAATGLAHPQAGIIIGHFQHDRNVDPKSTQKTIDRVRAGVEAPVAGDLPEPPKGHRHWLVADVATGAGVARSIERYYALNNRDIKGQRVIVEGFGAVGAFTAFYLAQLGAVIVAVSSASDKPGTVRIAIDPAGLRAGDLVTASFNNGRRLPPAGHQAYNKKTTLIDCKASKAKALFDVQADIFVPAAASHTIDKPRLKALHKSGITVWGCGANNPFDHGCRPDNDLNDYHAAVKQMLKLMKDADKRFAIVPDFVSNSGMARAFAHLMHPGSKPTADASLADLRSSIDHAVDKLMATRPTGKKTGKPNAKQPSTNLLARGYQAFLG
jgi:glutamate dehydrogenase (NAD(P)+)